jgi:inorganic triphosphatase YgiF
MARGQQRKSSHRRKGREFELKLEVSKETLDHLRRLESIGGWTLEAPQSSHVQSVYFDTHDHRLHGHGVSLRVRSQKGSFTQTVKRGLAVANGVSTPAELETPLDGPDPDLDRISDKRLRREIKDFIDGAPLSAVFETDIARTTRGLSNKKVTLELALDDGVIRAGSHELDIKEAELELKSGAAGDMVAAAEALFAEHPFSVSRMSKAERGYHLILGRNQESPPTAGFTLSTFDQNETCRAVLTKLIAACTRQIIGNRQVVLETDDPEGAHQMRVGLRRLRAALRSFGPLLGDTAKPLADHSQLVARAVGELRDADVLLHDILAAIAGSVHEVQGFGELEQALNAYRSEKREAVRALLHGAGWRALQLELGLWPQTLDDNRLLDSPICDWAPQALDRAWKKATKKGKRIEELDVSERHELRKALKNLRYTVEYFGALYPARETKPFSRQLKTLQDTFGYLNDAATAAKITSIARDHDASSGVCREAAGYVLGWHAARAEASWKEAVLGWSSVKAEDKFWR